MEGKNIFQNGGDFLLRGGKQINPNKHPFVGANQPEGIAVEVAGYEFSIIENEGLNHRTEE
jgi:hypothetical protein